MALLCNFYIFSWFPHQNFNERNICISKCKFISQLIEWTIEKRTHKNTEITLFFWIGLNFSLFLQCMILPATKFWSIFFLFGLRCTTNLDILKHFGKLILVNSIFYRIGRESHSEELLRKNETLVTNGRQICRTESNSNSQAAPIFYHLHV